MNNLKIIPGKEIKLAKWHALSIFYLRPWVLKILWLNLEK